METSMTDRYGSRTLQSRGLGTKTVPDSLRTVDVSYGGMRWIQERLRSLPGKTGAGLARAIGKPKSRVYELFRGDWSLQVTDLPGAARYLEMSLEELTAKLQGAEVQKGLLAQKTMPRRNSEISEPLLIWSSSPVSGKDRGVFMLSSEKAGEAERPSALRYSKKAFAFKIIGSDNRPAFRSGDIAVTNPDEPADIGDDCVFTNGLLIAAGALAIVGNLTDITPDLWIITQYAVSGLRELARKDFPDAWRIVTKHYRR